MESMHTGAPQWGTLQVGHKMGPVAPPDPGGANMVACLVALSPSGGSSLDQKRTARTWLEKAARWSGPERTVMKWRVRGRRFNRYPEIHRLKFSFLGAALEDVAE